MPERLFPWPHPLSFPVARPFTQDDDCGALIFTAAYGGSPLSLPSPPLVRGRHIRAAVRAGR